jgi:hypothetical protein
MSIRCTASAVSLRSLAARISGPLLLGLTLLCAVPARAFAASGPDETALDATALTLMELRADHAVARDRCFLYAELLHGLTELAGRQMAAGQAGDELITLRQMNEVTAKIEAATGRDARKLKDVEQLLEHTSRRLSDMVRSASEEQRSTMQAALKRLNAAHTSVLAMVFAQ